MYDNTNYEKSLQERIKNITEPVIDCSVLNTTELKKVKEILEGYNLNNRTSFWLDEKTKEIVDANVLEKSKSVVKLKKLLEYFENRGFDKMALTESVASKKNTIERLYESEIDKAEIILATQLIVDRLQKIVENLSSIIYEEVIPISDKIKVVLGKNTSEYWTNRVKKSLDNLINIVIETKDEIFKVSSDLEKISWSGKELNDMNVYDGTKENSKSADKSIDDVFVDTKDEETSKDRDEKKKENNFRELKDENSKREKIYKEERNNKKNKKIAEALKIIIEDIRDGLELEKAVKSASIISGLNYKKLLKIVESAAVALKKKA